MFMEFKWRFSDRSSPHRQEPWESNLCKTKINPFLTKKKDLYQLQLKRMEKEYLGAIKSSPSLWNKLFASKIPPHKTKPQNKKEFWTMNRKNQT